MPGLRRARRTAAGAAWAVLAVSVLLLAVSLALDIAAADAGPGVDLGPGFGALYALAGVVIAACAVVILWHDPTQRFGGALLLVSAAWTLDGLSQSYVRYAVRPNDALAGANLALWYLDRFGAVLPLSIASLLLIFPTGRFLPGWLGRLGIVALVGMVTAVLVTILIPATDAQRAVTALPAEIDLNYLTLPISTDLTELLRNACLVVTMLGVLISMVTAVVRHRRSTGVERDQMRWLVWAVLVVALVLAVAAATEIGQASDALVVISAVLPVLAMTVGVVRPGVLPVESLLLRTIVLAAVALCLLAVDLVVVAVLTALLGGLDERQLVAVVLLATALAYGPLRHRLSLLVHRWFLGSRGNRYDVVAGLAASLESADDGSAQLGEVARAVADAFGVGYVAVEVDRPGGERLTATYGERPEEVRTLPVTYRGTVVGRLVLPARGVRSRLSSRDEKLLGDLVRQAATAARTSQLAEELQASRERLVSTREEERRRIRRDLHDGLGPAMAGVVFQLETARLLVENDPARAREVLDQVGGQLQDVVADVRRLVHELRPPALDDRGLIGAVRQLTENQPVTVEIDAEDLGPLPAAVEVAAYRIIGESVTNVVRHAQARSVRIGLGRDDSALVVEVADDGIGIGADVQAGVGLLSVRERAAELGGQAEVSCPASGGTLVRAVLPLPRRDAEEAGTAPVPTGKDTR